MSQEDSTPATPAPATSAPAQDMMQIMTQMMQQQMQMMQQMQSQQQMHFSQSPKKAQELEAGLNVLRNDYKREQLTLRKDEEYDPIEAQEIKSSASTKTIQEEKDQDKYLT
ncbi:hypothetical protein TVAG_155400, partial [Trichomonas vaginalis G3]